MPVRKKVERRLEIGLGTVEGPIMKVIAGLRDYEEQYGPSARLELEYGYEGGDQLLLVFEDVETDAEYDARMNARKKKREEKQKREDEAFATYLKLKKRFDYREETTDDV
jgi:hypothetical protein